jgi:hypothetical protein
MIKILEEHLFDYDLNLDSKVSDIDDVYDFINFIINCEIYYNMEIFDDEAEFIEFNDLSLRNVEDFFIFLRDGYATESIHKLIIDNIDWLSRIRPDYRWYIINNRDSKIDLLFNSI